MRKLLPRLAWMGLVIGIILGAAVTPAGAVTPTTDPPGVGNDVSWPQCGKPLPARQAFGVVGVNDGLANNTNPCSAAELAWAAKSLGSTGQPKTALYVNTGNPGLTGSWWPSSNEYPAGQVVSNPYGTCAHGDDPACAYMYGYAKAYDDVNARGVPAGPHLWWLDVETTNSWEANKVANLADLEGMAYYFTGSANGSVGIYSTGYQWNVITGTPSVTTLSGLPNWVPGARTLKGAQSNCRSAPFTPGSRIVLTQYVSGSFDFDWSCT